MLCRTPNNVSNPPSSLQGVYALWSVGQSACSLINLLFLAHRGVQAARNLHDSMLVRIFKASTHLQHSTTHPSEEDVYN